MEPLRSKANYARPIVALFGLPSLMEEIAGQVPVRGLLLLALLAAVLSLAGLMWGAERLRVLAATDGLTRLCNRRVFAEMSSLRPARHREIFCPGRGVE